MLPYSEHSTVDANRLAALVHAPFVRTDGEDAAQDLWLTYLDLSPGRVQNVVGWLRRSLRRRTHLLRRRNRLRRERERRAARSEELPSVLEGLALDSLRHAVTATVLELGEPYREVIRLRFLEEQEIEEVARRLGRSPATVRSQIRRGLAHLRPRLAAHA